jgi:hypothetical protein
MGLPLVVRITPFSHPLGTRQDPRGDGHGGARRHPVMLARLSDLPRAEAVAAQPVGYTLSGPMP